MTPKPRQFALACALLLAGCATVPTGPTVLVLPGSGKSFEQFRHDDATCRQYALDQTAGARQAASDSGVKSAVVGTAIGAVAGAAIGGREGAAIGAGGGLIVGSAAGSDSSRYSSYGAQRQYDHAYIQCMYATGHKVPVPGGMIAPAAVDSKAATSPPPPPAPTTPPPPAPTPPPPR
jgi:hypothetical protein